MKLTAIENPEAVRRYTHVRPARPWQARCARVCPGTSHACTLPRGHRGPHVSHRTLRKIAAVWDGAEGAAAPARTRKHPGPRRPIGLRARTPSDLLTTVRSIGSLIFSMGEEIALGVFFLAFVWFGIEWLLLIFR